MCDFAADVEDFADDAFRCLDALAPLAAERLVIIEGRASR